MTSSTDTERCSHCEIGHAETGYLCLSGDAMEMG